MCVTKVPDNEIGSCAAQEMIDSTGLKRFGRDKWHQERHKVSAKRSWRKLHIAVDEKHVIQSCELTDRFTHDDQMVESLAEQIDLSVGHCTADGACGAPTTFAKQSFNNKEWRTCPRSNCLFEQLITDFTNGLCWIEFLRTHINTTHNRTTTKQIIGVLHDLKAFLTVCVSAVF